MAASRSSQTLQRPRRGSRPLWSFREKFLEARKVMPAGTLDPIPAPEETGWIQVFGPGHSRKQVRDAIRSLRLKGNGQPKETHPEHAARAMASAVSSPVSDTSSNSTKETA